MKHNIFAPSSAFIWRHCTASRILMSQEDDKTSAAAEHGRLLHDKTFNLMGKMFVDDNIYYTSDDEWVVKQAAKTAYNYIKNFDVDCYFNPYCFIEKYRALEMLHIKLGGTPDIALLKFTKATADIFIIDFKFGISELISAVNNSQLILYAEAARQYFMYRLAGLKITLHYAIIQTSCDHVSEFFDVKEDTHLELFINIISILKTKALVYKIGKHCRYCNVKLKCKEFKKQLDLLNKLKDN